MGLIKKNGTSAWLRPYSASALDLIISHLLKSIFLNFQTYGGFLVIVLLLISSLIAS